LYQYTWKLGGRRPGNSAETFSAETFSAETFSAETFAFLLKHSNSAETISAETIGVWRRATVGDFERLILLAAKKSE
jgi:hypothetical protein